VVVKLKIRNKDRNMPAKILSYKTIDPPDPIDMIEDNIFTVVLEGGDGNPSEYLGPHAKRMKPSADDYLVIKPGKQLTKKVDLADFYDFSESGTYKVTYTAKNDEIFGDSNPGTSLVSNTLMIFVEGRPKSSKSGKKGGGGGNAGPSCDSSQLSIIEEANAEAVACTVDSNTHLSGLGNPASDRYAEWFGSYNTNRVSRVTSNFGAIYSILSPPGQIEWDCKCKQKNVYAYVYPNVHKVYFCGAFWATDMTGTDSKQGVIVHEASHFNDVANTDDWAYGQSACSSLADSDPMRAVDNADSHEYFCENTPGLTRK
jgi:peptidyl-Lys metalloendopeptidase